MAEIVRDKTGRVLFTKQMREEGYTILAPNMLPVHFKLFAKAFQQAGYNVIPLTSSGREIVNEGLHDVHNDTCYPALLVIGQLINALKSGKYDLNKSSFDDYPNRRRLPGQQLHSSAAEGAEKDRV